ncbi:MAG: Gfo/Idh/MocA family oxidoreductase [Symbiobacteriia bacterium]
MTLPVKVGLVGAGVMGGNHARVLARLPRHFAFSGIYDPDTVRASALARQYETLAFPTLAALQQAADAVVIAAPTRIHHELGLHLLQAGKSVLMEKPLALTVAQCRDLVETSERFQAPLQVGHIERFNPAVQALQGVLADEDIFAWDFNRVGPHDPHRLEVDVVSDLMVHDLDILLALSPQFTEADIQAAGWKLPQTPDWDYVAATLSLPNGGQLATFRASRVSQDKIRRLEITARGAFVVTDFMERRLLINRRIMASIHGRYHQESQVEKVLVSAVEPLQAELEHFALVAAREAEPLVTGWDGLRAVQLVNRIRTQLGSPKAS